MKTTKTFVIELDDDQLTTDDFTLENGDDFESVITHEYQMNNDFDNDISKDYIKAHKHSINNQEQLNNDKLCGCFFCLMIFPPKKITHWLKAEGTALCPYCGVDSIIGESSGYELSKESLKRMYDFWFGIPRPDIDK